VRALLNHDPNEVLGRTKSGTLRLFDEQRGLRFELDLPDSPLGQNMRAAISRGDLDGASFRFEVGDEAWDGDVRTVKSVKALRDVTLATYPAYPAASVELRTKPSTKEAPKMDKPTTGEAVEEAVLEPEDETRTNGRLRVEDATSEPPSVEERVREALLDVRKGETRALTTASTLSPGELSSFLWEKLRSASVGLAVPGATPRGVWLDDCGERPVRRLRLAAHRFQRRLRPPRGTMYISTMRPTMTATTMATTATVEKATSTRPFYPRDLSRKPTARPRRDGRTRWSGRGLNGTAAQGRIRAAVPDPCSRHRSSDGRMYRVASDET
jgi:HK97 family phage prohead protease